MTGAQVVGWVLADLVLIVAAARLVGAAAQRIGQPRVVGEIVAGVLLGPSLLGAHLGVPLPDVCARVLGPDVPATVTACLFPPPAQAVLNVIGQLALLLFIFLAGLQLDLDQLRGTGRRVGAVAGAAVAVPVVAGFALTPLLYREGFVEAFGTAAAPSRLAFTVFLGALVSITALPVMVRILQEKRMEATDLGAVGIAAAAAVTVLMFVLVALAVGIAAGDTPGMLALKGVGVAAYLGVLLGIVRPAIRGPLERAYLARARALDDAPHTLDGFAALGAAAPSGVGWVLSPGMFAWILVGVITSGWIAHVLGLTVIVGGFLAGLVLPARSALARDLTAELFDLVVVVLLPVFLAFAGLRTDFTALRPELLPGIAVFLVVCVAAKWLPGVVVGRAVGLDRTAAGALGWLLNCRGLLPLVVAIVGTDRGVLAPGMQVAVVVMALVTTAMTGPLVDATLARSRGAERPA